MTHFALAHYKEGQSFHLNGFSSEKIYFPETLYIQEEDILLDILIK